MLRAVWLALAFVSAAVAGEQDIVLHLRHLSDADPALALAEGRKMLDGGKFADEPSRGREALRWMGRAAMILSDDAAIAEVALRLDGFAQTHGDSVAKAYAGFLRAQRLQTQNHARDALAEALASADLLADKKDPNLLAISDFSLCDAYFEVEEFARALPYCQHARQRWHDSGNAYDEARAINLEAQVRFNQRENDDAIALLKQARERLSSIGEDTMVVSIDDNLARLYIEQGHPAEALELARKAYASDKATGRALYAVLGRANVARALSALKRHDEAQKEIAAAVAEARERKLGSTLPDLLDTQSRIAEAAGDLPLALKTLRESDDLDQNAPKQANAGTAIAELEARFAAREKELQIRELEHANHVKQLQLTTAAARHEDELARQRLVLAAAAAGIFALAVIAVLLFLLLRAQRRHGAELTLQALRDPLTGVDNRRALFTTLRKLLEEAAPPRPHGLLLVDLDHFKRINDCHGHPAGDAVLVAVAEKLRQTLGPRGNLARLGGEEFTVLHPAAGRDAVLELAEELREAIAAVAVPPYARPGQVTASIGVALFGGDESVDDWMRAADRALYAAKARGRNCVVEAASVRLDFTPDPAYS